MMDQSKSSHQDHADQAVGTTGHEWDGIQEFNNPLPRWWLYTFYACILWAVGYWVFYPAIPLLSGFTKGAFGWASRTQIEIDMEELKASRHDMVVKIEQTPLADIEKNAELLSFARAQGGAAFAVNCSTCHGAGAQGFKGYPNLNDDDWLWGGKLSDIEQTITHGVRWDADQDTRTSAMPAFGRDGLLPRKDILVLADYVMSLGGLPVEKGADLAAGQKLFAANCAACHGDQGKGNQEMGAPNLTDKVWLYGSDRASIIERITIGGGGVMPAWGNRLDKATIKSLTVYVHSLGGGQ
jgi:cytochrome c oxidase cbb3-type subunit III